ncbi:MAG: ABC transporter permease subunit [Phyllobacteriaceae bacterium]|nr:ABC transporter permease subunit [Phyllobacteriaceae bacterium]
MAEVKGRSLLDDALTRLLSNRAAVASMIFLAVMTVVCFVGPSFTGHPFDKVYSDYVRVGPSLEARPSAAEVRETAGRIARRFRAEVDGFEMTAGRVSLALSSARPIDPRIADYFARADGLRSFRVVPTEGDPKTLRLVGEVERLHFWFGTDGNGRDLLTRVLIGGRISILIGLLASGVALLIGVSWGATAGFLGGRVDMVMMRIVDVLYALPFIFFVILLVVFFGRNFVLMFVAVGAIEWLDMARIVRGQTLVIKRQEYVQAAEALGVTTAALIRRHVVPNTLGPVVVYVTLLVPKVILLESFLSFLGLGVQEPMTSWGVLISEGANNNRDLAYLLIFPAMFLTSTLFALNFLGDGLRDALDPKDR